MRPPHHGSQKPPGLTRILRGAKRGLLIVLLSALAVAGAWAQMAGQKTLVLAATAYTSSVRETDSTPFVTATGMRARLGVLAVRPDLLKVLPYGTKVRLKDLGSVYGRAGGSLPTFSGSVASGWPTGGTPGCGSRGTSGVPTGPRPCALAAGG